MSPLTLAAPSEVRVFPARLSVLHDVEAFIQAFAARNGVAERNVLRLLLVVEELFTNTVMHGYGTDSDRPIEIALARSEDNLRLVYRDAARAYDPLATLPASRSNLPLPAEERSDGRLGVLLVSGLARDVEYTRDGDWNRLDVVLDGAG